MAVERLIQPDPNDPFDLLPAEDEDFDIETVEVDGVLENDDGSMDVVLEQGGEAGTLPAEHDANLAESMDEDELVKLSGELTELFDADVASRKDWEDAYLEGLDFLGIKVEERSKPWPGAAGVYHPMLMEAVVRFQSQAMQEIFPPAGPAKTRILGKETPEKLKKARRVQEELNYHLTCRMPDYRGETERLLFRLGLVGSVFRKIYFDPIRKRPSAKFVPAEDFVVPYGETDLSTAERFTHINRLSENELKRYQIAGLYRDVELGEGSVVATDVSDKEGELTGVKPSSPGTERHTILEMHVDYDLGEDPQGVPLPYVVTLDKDSGEVLAIRRNWEEQDDGRNRRSWFVAYEYVPGLGFYGFGLVHLIGGIAKSVTAILRQLIDAGTLSNLPGGLKSRGLRIKGDDTPIRPGEFRDVDVVGGKIAEAITFLPYKEPSAVLHNLLQQLVEEGRRVGSIADVDVGDMSSEAPVGTTLALLERAQKVMSAVQSRLHASLGKELKLIAHIISKDMPDQYDFEVDVDANEQVSRQADFASTAVEIIPVSDPGATTMSQRVVQHQAALQMASQAPQVYDIPKLHRVGLEILGIKEAEEIVKLAEDHKPVDPISENMALIQGQPVKAFIHQDHNAHIAVHMAAVQDPKIAQMVGQSPNAQLIMAAAQAHIAEHMAFAYRMAMEQAMGGPLPQPGEEIPPEMEAEIARAAVPAAQQILAQNQQVAAQEEAQQLAQDPLVQLQARELAVKEIDQQRKAETDFAKIMVDAQKSKMKTELELARIEAQKEIEGMRLGVHIAESAADMEQRAAESAEKLGIEAEKVRASKAKATKPKGD